MTQDPKTRKANDNNDKADSDVDATDVSGADQGEAEDPEVHRPGEPRT